MTRLGMIIDLTRCIGCYACQMACRDEFVGHDFLPYSMAQSENSPCWMRVHEQERGQYPKVKVSYTPTLCQQCKDAPCIKKANEVAPGAIYQRPDGIVIIDPAKAAGHKELVDSCPYGVITWNNEKNVPQKCGFNAHLLDNGWTVPRCVAACPVDALIFGDLDDPNSKVSKLTAEGKTETLHPEYNLETAVKYIGLARRFLAGTVVFEDTDECGEGVKVTVLQEGVGEGKVTKTDNYGDFEFEGLDNEKTLQVVFEHPKYSKKTIDLETLEADLWLGEVKLSKN